MKRMYEKPVALKHKNNPAEPKSRGLSKSLVDLVKKNLSVIRQGDLSKSLKVIEEKKNGLKSGQEWMDKSLRELTHLEINGDKKAVQLRKMLKKKAIELELERYTAEIVVTALEQSISRNLSGRQLDEILERRKTIIEHIIGLEKAQQATYGSERMLSTVNKRWACSQENISRISQLYDRMSLLEKLIKSAH